MREITSIERPDGATWRSFETDSCEVLLTSRGAELVDSTPDIERVISLYMRKALGKTMLAGGGIRTFFAEGSNSKIYTVSDDILMKETRGHSMQAMLERMDVIDYVIDAGNVPRWIDMPDHYGIIIPKHDDMQYVMMQRIDGGVNVDHILNPDESSELERRGVLSEFGGEITAQTQNEVRQRYADCEKILHQAIAEEDLIPSDLLSDWHPGNVLVERLHTPIARSPYKMWVIDQ